MQQTAMVDLDQCIVTRAGRRMEPHTEQDRRIEARRKAPGNRAGDKDLMGSDHLSALLDSIRDAQRRDREVYDAHIAELKARQDTSDEKVDRLRSRFAVAVGVVLVLSTIAGWFGRPVVSALVSALTP